MENEINKPVEMEQQMALDNFQKAEDVQELSVENESDIGQIDNEPSVLDSKIKPIQSTQQTNNDLIDIEADPDLSDGETVDVELKQEDAKKVIIDGEEVLISKEAYEIESVDIGYEKIKSLLANREPMKPFSEEKPDVVGYKTKMRIKYKGTSYVSYIPNIKWYPNNVTDSNGKIKKVLKPWFGREIQAKDLKDPFKSTISKLYFMFCESQGIPQGKLSQKQFVKDLVGKKVILKQWYGTGKYSKSRRLDILKFV